MNQLLQLIEDRDLEIPVPRCGKLLKLARLACFVADDPEHGLTLTDRGRAWLHPYELSVYGPR